MTPLEAARQWVSGGEEPSYETAARILATLEAAEDLLTNWSTSEPVEERATDTVFMFCGNPTRLSHAPDCPWETLVTAIKGEE